eukprot:2736592-Pleurochrysis_carterae.AAC.2
MRAWHIHAHVAHGRAHRGLTRTGRDTPAHQAKFNTKQSSFCSQAMPAHAALVSPLPHVLPSFPR